MSVNNFLVNKATALEVKGILGSPDINTITAGDFDNPNIYLRYENNKYFFQMGNELMSSFAIVNGFVLVGEHRINFNTTYQNTISVFKAYKLVYFRQPNSVMPGEILIKYGNINSDTFLRVTFGIADFKVSEIDIWIDY